jgi:hypothetical protein
MNHRTGVSVFMVIAAAVLLAVPASNLTQAATRTLSAQLIAQVDVKGLANQLFRSDQLEAWLATAAWRAGISTHPDKVIVGYDGWLHLGDHYASTLSVMRGERGSARQERARELGRSLQRWQAWLRVQGVSSMHFMVGPNKQTIYPQTLPRWVRVNHPGFVPTLAREGGSIVLDLRPALQAAAASHTQPLYYRTDTHWNQLGAAHAFVQLGRRMRELDGDLRLPIEAPLNVQREQSRAGGDLAHFLRISHALRDKEIHLNLDRPERYVSTVSDFDTRKPLFERRFAQVDFPAKTVHVRTPEAANSRRVLWLRDSFGTKLSPFMASAFEEIVQLHWHRGMENDARLFKQLVRQWKPDAVVFTVVERDALSGLFLAAAPFD